jgi:hypothetical protein
MLNQYAAFHLHPERLVDSSIGDGTAFARCYYFNRPSNPQQEAFADAEERVQNLDECQEALRRCASNYLNEEFRCANAIKEDDSLADVESLKLQSRQLIHSPVHETTLSVRPRRNEKHEMKLRSIITSWKTQDSSRIWCKCDTLESFGQRCLSLQL